MAATRPPRPFFLSHAELGSIPGALRFAAGFLVDSFVFIGILLGLVKVEMVPHLCCVVADNKFPKVGDDACGQFICQFVKYG
jgi:hypothetical protein